MVDLSCATNLYVRAVTKRTQHMSSKSSSVRYHVLFSYLIRPLPLRTPYVVSFIHIILQNQQILHLSKLIPERDSLDIKLQCFSCIHLKHGVLAVEFD